MLWALTGCSGTGVSQVASVWRELGAEVCSLDRIGHSFLAREEVLQELNRELSIPDVDFTGLSVEQIRALLREQAFRNKDILKGVNRVLHPRLRNWVRISALTLRSGKRRCEDSKKSVVYVLDAALMFELGLENIPDFTVTVKDTWERVSERLINRDGLSEEAARGRWSSQLPIKQKAERSHFVIENSGDLNDIHSKAKMFYINVIKRMEDANWHTKPEKS